MFRSLSFSKNHKDIGFDNDLYLEAQKAQFMKRLEEAGEKLYVEVGGKLCNDFHAARVLPGYQPNVKVSLLKELAQDSEVIVCINAEDVESGRVRTDFGVTYDSDLMNIVRELRNLGILVSSVVITQFNGQKRAQALSRQLEQQSIKVYTHPKLEDYPHDLDRIVSSDGFGKCAYVETTKKIVIVTAPGPGSGKLATCLSQLYHEFRNGVKAGYAKYETFPVWNLELRHPINVAYEAATLDLRDMNEMDTFHKEAYGVDAVSYNRDMEAFPVLKEMFSKVMNKECPYQSPTDFGVNCVKDGITNDKFCQDAAKQEIIRRYLRCKANFIESGRGEEALQMVQKMMSEFSLKEEDRRVVPAARQASRESKRRADKRNEKLVAACGSAIQLLNGDIIQGHNSSSFHSASAAVISAAKRCAGIPDEMHILTTPVIDAVRKMKEQAYLREGASMDVSEVLICLAVTSSLNPTAGEVFKHIHLLNGCEMHLSHIPSKGDVNGLTKLGIQFTYDPVYARTSLLDL